MTKIVSIHSFRGGMGKTFLLSFLAENLAKNKRVGVVDCDFQAPSLHIWCKVDPSDEMRSVFLGQKPLKAAVSQRKNLNFLCFAPEAKGIVEYLRDKIDPALFLKTLQTFQEEYKLDYLLLDTHSGINEENLHILSFSDVALIVVDGNAAELPFSEIAQKLGVPKHYFVLNRSSTSKKNLDAISIPRQTNKTFSNAIQRLAKLL